MLTLTDLTRRYSGTDSPAVEGVSLEVPEGEILALVGESGSGKTTLLRLIAGLEYPDAGTVEIGGLMVADADAGCWVPPEKREIGFVFQDGALFPHLTVAANTAYGLGKRSREEKEEIVSAMLSMTGLDGYQNRYPHELSGGERQRLAVARALAPHPKLILLDEPFSNLDPALRRTLREEIVDILTKAKTTAVMVTHDTDDALVAGDRIAVFRDAHIEQIGTPKEVYTQPKNGYCAQLFGPANQVTIDGSPTWVRPEDMHLGKVDAGGNAIPVTLLALRNAGRHIEAQVIPTDPSHDQNEPWILYLNEHPEGFEEGKKYSVTVD